MKRRLLVCLIGCIGLLASAAQAQTLTFSVVPQQSASKLARLWTPILEYLGEKSGLDLKFSTAKNIPVFEQRLAEGRYDIAYMNPYHYTVFGEQPGYRAFARQKDKRIKGIIVARRDSDYTGLEDLAGDRLAFPSPAAFAASLLPRAQLEQEKIDFEPNYVSSHDSVYLTVSKGLFSAGGGVMRTFNNTDPAVREQLKILWTTNAYTPHAFAAHPSVSPDAIERLREAMLGMNDDPAAQALLKSINFKGFIAAGHGDWDDVRALGISELD